MKRILKIVKDRKGSALVYVLIVAIILVMLIAVALVATANANRQSAFTRDYERSYYAAESATQLAGEMFLKDLATAENTFSLQRNFNHEPTDIEIAAIKLAYKDGLQDAMRKLYQSTVDTVNDMQFNGVYPTLLNTGLIVDYESILVDISMVPLRAEQIDGDPVIMEALLIASLSEVQFTLQGTAGDGADRTAIISYSLQGIMGMDGEINAVTETEGEGWKPNTELDGMNGETIVAGGSADNQAKYDDFKGRFENVLSNAVDYSNSVAVKLFSMDYSSIGATIISPPSGSTTINANDNSMRFERVRHVGNLTLNGTLTGSERAYIGGTGFNSSVEYLLVEGNLTIAGNVSFPNLKEVYVTGNLIISGNNNIVAGNSTKELIQDSDPPSFMISGTNFIVGGTITMSNGTTTAFDCRFYASETITIEGSSLYGNSVYIAHGTNGRININQSGRQSNFNIGNVTPSTIFNSDYSPQFYAGKDINLYAQGAPKYSAIMAALDSINNNGNSTVSDMRGFMLVGYGSIGKLRIAGGSDGQLSDDAIGNLLDYGLIFSSTQKTVTTMKITGIEYIFNSIDLSSILEIDNP